MAAGTRHHAALLVQTAAGAQGPAWYEALILPNFTAYLASLRSKKSQFAQEHASLSDASNVAPF